MWVWSVSVECEHTCVRNEGVWGSVLYYLFTVMKCFHYGFHRNGKNVNLQEVHNVLQMYHVATHFVGNPTHNIQVYVHVLYAHTFKLIMNV